MCTVDCGVFLFVAWCELQATVTTSASEESANVGHKKRVAHVSSLGSVAAFAASLR